MITALTLAPVLAALIILAVPERRARVVALAGSLISLGLMVYMLMHLDLDAKGVQFKEKIAWIPGFGIDYFVGLDGVNALVLLLATLLAPLVVLASWKQEERSRTYFVLLCIQFTGPFRYVYRAQFLPLVSLLGTGVGAGLFPHQAFWFR